MTILNSGNVDLDRATLIYSLQGHETLNLQCLKETKLGQINNGSPFCIVCFFFFPTVGPRCVWCLMTRHILVLPKNKICVLLYILWGMKCLQNAQSVHNKTQNLCLGILHPFLKNMDQVKGKQGKKNKQKRNNTFVLYTIRTHC